MNCKDQQHGHSFLYSGGDCQSCGINQYALNKKEKKIDKSYSVGKDKGKSPRGVLFNDMVDKFKIKDKGRFRVMIDHYDNSMVYEALSSYKGHEDKGIRYFFGILKNVKKRLLTN